LADTLSKIANAVRRFPPYLAYEYARYRRNFPKTKGFCGIYSSFDEALAEAPPELPRGYDSDEPARMYEDRLSRVFPSDYPVLFWLNRLLGANMHVVDFGGHVGIAFYAYDRYLSYPEGLRYTVVDVPAVVAHGQELARKRGETRLNFTADAAAVGPHELLLASGSTQYLEPADPMANLDRLGRLPDHVILNRIPIHPSQTFVTLQNIGTTVCPYRIYRRDTVLQGFNTRGYDVMDEWQNLEHACMLPFDRDHSVPFYTGFLLRKRSLGGTRRL
jgi:putative methyltransferase (TIGR04325 family)